MKLPIQSHRGQHEPRPSMALMRRQAAMPQATRSVIIFSVVIGCLLCGGLILTFVLRYLRSHHATPKYLPGKWLKAKWEGWVPSAEKKRYSSSLQSRRQGTRTPSVGFPAFAQGNGESSNNRSSDAPDRHTSVRSTITLPAYSSAARPTEQILGREGERAGIDTVIEFPETGEEEEERRDQTMESLYQIRIARRDERAEREAQRQTRREARARNDRTTLAELRRAQLAAGESDSAALVAAHQKLDSRGRVSTVNYQDLGVARHDGSRLRAHSNDSNRSLLGGAARMGSDTDSASRLGTTFGNPSTSSLRFMSADYSDDEAVSDVESTNTPSRLQSRVRLAGTEDVPDFQPPQYDEVSLEATASNLPRQPPPVATALPSERPPSYASPMTAGAPELPLMANIPSIEVTPTPLSPREA